MKKKFRCNENFISVQKLKQTNKQKQKNPYKSKITATKKPKTKTNQQKTPKHMPCKELHLENISNLSLVDGGLSTNVWIKIYYAMT